MPRTARQMPNSEEAPVIRHSGHVLVLPIPPIPTANGRPRTTMRTTRRTMPSVRKRRLSTAPMLPLSGGLS